MNWLTARELAGLPGMSLPCGMADGLPVGLQLIGNYFDEARLLCLIDFDIVHQFRRELVEIDRTIAAAVRCVAAVEGGV